MEKQDMNEYMKIAKDLLHIIQLQVKQFVHAQFHQVYLIYLVIK